MNDGKQPRFNPIASMAVVETVAARIVAAIIDPRVIIDSYQTLEEQVHAGEPIYVTGQMSEPIAKLHVATVNRLLEATGQPVTVTPS